MNVNDIVAERIAAARARIEATKRRRAALAAARQRGLAHRHAAKLRNLQSPDSNAGMGQQPTTEGRSTKVQPNRGDTPTVLDDAPTSGSSSRGGPPDPPLTAPQAALSIGLTEGDS